MSRLDNRREIAAVQASSTPRATRLKFENPLSFHADGVTVSGQCVDISDSGMLAKFVEAPEAWITGELIIQTEKDLFVIRARVARVDGLNAGLVFRPETEAEHEAIRLLLDLVVEAIKS